MAPLAQLARAHIQLRSDVGEWQATLDQALNRLGLILAGEPPPGSFLGHSILLGGLGSLQNPPRHRGKPSFPVGPKVTAAHWDILQVPTSIRPERSALFFVVLWVTRSRPESE